MSIAINLNRIINAREWTPEELAVAMQRIEVPVSVQSINRWLSGKGDPKSDTIIALANALECTTDDILIGRELKAAS